MKRKIIVLLVASLFASLASREGAEGQITQTQFSNVQVKLQPLASLEQTLAPSSDGGYFEASRRNGSVQVFNAASGGVGTLEFGTTDGALLTKRSAEGKDVWCVGFEGNVSIQKIAATPNGGAIVGGVYQGPFNYMNADGTKVEVNTDPSAVIEKLFVLELQSDGKLVAERVLLPKHLEPALWTLGKLQLRSLEYVAANDELRMVLTIAFTIKLGNPEHSYEVPTHIEGWAYYASNILLSLKWSSQKVISSFQIHNNPDRFGDHLRASEVASLLAQSDQKGGIYLGRTFFGAVDEIDQLASVGNTIEHAKTSTNKDSLNLLILERRDAQGTNVWKEPLKVLVSYYEDEKAYYRSNATINFVSPIGDGARFIAVGFFDAPLLFDDGTRLEPAREKFGMEEGYCTDVFLIIGDSETGKVIAKKKLGLSLFGYISKLPGCQVYPLSALLDGEDLILALPLHGTIKVNGIEHASKDGGNVDRDPHNALLANVSLRNGETIQLEHALSLTHVGKVSIDALVMSKPHLYRYIGRVASTDSVEEMTKLYVNGVPIEGGIANAWKGDVSIAGEFALVAQLQVKIKHPETVVLKLQKNDEQAITYGEGVKLPYFTTGDKLKVTAELKAGSEDKFALLPIVVNNKTVSSEYIFDGSSNVIEVQAGAYKTVKPILVTVTPADCKANVVLEVGGKENKFTGDRATDPQVLLKNGEGAFTLNSVGFASADYVLDSITIQGTRIPADKMPYAYAKLPEDDTADYFRVNVFTKKLANYEVKVEVDPDLTYGTVTITPEGAAPVVFEGDPAKYPKLQVRARQKITVLAKGNSKGKFDSLEINGRKVTNGSLYEIPDELSRNELHVKAHFSKGTAVQVHELASVSLRSNPVLEDFVVEGSWSGDLRYTLYNAGGVLLREGMATAQGSLRIGASGLPVGVYFLHLEDSTGASATLKAVKQ